MANRVTEAEVKEIAPEITITPLLPFIVAANLLVNQIATGCGSDLPDEQLKEVERWLAAHLAYMAQGTSGGTKQRESIARGDYDVTYAVTQIGSGISGTPYGQMANTLSSGCLGEYQKPRVQLFAAGPT